ncbi:MAG: hypothetical protein RMJ51_06240 [Candidatus Calescibacterium sp.]|nr:hypothetical protein [Candidatus Calescibacterium sp.]MCX7971609.1 hypothetical protein [bacterium]MDW8195817.1 hypothetical protein [Candidatus Calescibacterium sp.]
MKDNLNRPKAKLLFSFFSIIITFVLLSFIFTLLTSPVDQKIDQKLDQEKEERKIETISKNKTQNLYLPIKIQEIYDYTPKNYTISRCKLNNLSIELQIHTKKGIYKVYIYPELYIREINKIKTTRKITEYLKTIDSFMYKIQNRERNSFRELYLFDTKKIYAY